MDNAVGNLWRQPVENTYPKLTQPFKKQKGKHQKKTTHEKPWGNTRKKRKKTSGFSDGSVALYDLRGQSSAVTLQRREDRRGVMALCWAKSNQEDSRGGRKGLCFVCLSIYLLIYVLLLFSKKNICHCFFLFACFLSLLAFLTFLLAFFWVRGLGWR